MPELPASQGKTLESGGINHNIDLSEWKVGDDQYGFIYRFTTEWKVGDDQLGDC